MTSMPPKIISRQIALVWIATISICALAFSTIYLSRNHTNTLAKIQITAREVNTNAHKLNASTHAILASRDNVWALTEAWLEANQELSDRINRLCNLDTSLLPQADLTNWYRVRGSYAVLQTYQKQLASSIARLKAQGFFTKAGQSLHSALEGMVKPDAVDPRFAELITLIGQADNFTEATAFFHFSLENLIRNLSPSIQRQLLLVDLATLTLLSLSIATIGLLMGRILILNQNLRIDIQARRASEENLLITLDSIGDAVIATDRQGIITRINPIATQLLGCPQREALGQPVEKILTIVDKHNNTPLPSAASAVLRREEPIHFGQDSILISRDGTRRPIAENAAPIRNAQNEIQGTVIIIRDLTEQTRLAEQVRISQRLEPLGQLAAGVAHDFNNILQAIRGSIALARDPATPPEDLALFHENIDQAARRAADLTSQLLAFGRRQSLNKSVHDLNQLTHDILKMLRRLIGPHIEIDYVPYETPALIHADRSQIEQIILNLCINARDAMPDGGKITLRIHRDLLVSEPAAPRASTATGHHYCIHVSDTGHGMDEDTRRRIFDPFFTTKQLGQGTGLGLAVVLGVVQQHHGTIQVDSQPGAGTTFRVYLPVAPAELATRHIKEDTTPPIPIPSHHTSSKALLLYAEDDTAVRSITTRILQRAGYQLLIAEDGQQAIELADQHHDKIQLAVCDIVMPRANGIQVRAHLHHLRPDLPVILCSGYTGTGLTGAADDIGPVLRKPFTPQELLRQIEEALAAAKPPQPEV